jgi:hypothetical protein
MSIADVTSRQLLAALKATTCPACGMRPERRCVSKTGKGVLWHHSHMQRWRLAWAKLR